jgi:hypothetical protein
VACLNPNLPIELAFRMRNLAAQLAVMRRVLVNISHSASGPGWASPAAVELREMAKRAVTADTIGADVWAVVEAADHWQTERTTNSKDAEAIRKGLCTALDHLREKGLL